MNREGDARLDEASVMDLWGKGFEQTFLSVERPTL